MIPGVVPNAHARADLRAHDVRVALGELSDHEERCGNVVATQHDAVSNMLMATDVYLKLPITGYLGRRFVIYLEPLSAPGRAYCFM